MIYVYALASMAALGLLFGIALGIAAKVFAVKVDPRVEQIGELLPGANCGGCGYAGCSAFASAVVDGTASPNGCVVGKDALAEQICKVMGTTCGSTENRYACVACNGALENAVNEGEYFGLKSCASAQVSGGGTKKCVYGCLGYGDCVKACQFNAIYIVEGSAIPEVDSALCTACGQCVKACPRGLISLRGESEPVFVACRSKAKGIEARKACSVSCIGCGICAKNCPSGAIKVENNLATIDQSLCTACGLCIERCPQKCIVDFRVVNTEVPEERDSEDVAV